jgi:hypothetical protein
VSLQEKTGCRPKFLFLLMAGRRNREKQGESVELGWSGLGAVFSVAWRNDAGKRLSLQPLDDPPARAE